MVLLHNQSVAWPWLLRQLRGHGSNWSNITSFWAP